MARAPWHLPLNPALIVKAGADPEISKRGRGSPPLKRGVHRMRQGRFDLGRGEQSPPLQYSNLTHFWSSCRANEAELWVARLDFGLSKF